MLLCVGKNSGLLIVLGQKLYTADRILGDHIGLDSEVEKRLQTGQFPIHRCGTQLLVCGSPLAIFCAGGLELARSGGFETLHVIWRNVVERSVPEVAQQRDAAHLIAAMGRVVGAVLLFRPS